MIKAAALAVIISSLSGCSVMGVALEYGVDTYCGEPLESREAVRAAANKAVSPHEMRITCDGDK